MVTENDILVSSKDLSSIFRINDIYDNPNINCIISEEGLWKDTIYKDLLLHKIGEFETHLGQTDIKVMAEDKDLMPGQFFVG